METALDRYVNKFTEKNIAWHKGSCVSAPFLDDCPINLECRVSNSLTTGDHTLFIGNVEAMHCDAAWLNADGTLNLEKVRTAAGRM